MKLLKAHSLFVGIFLLCAALRFLPLFDYQFTYDELSGMERTQFGSFGELIEKGVKIDAHPALIQLVIFALVKLFGYVTWIVKLPFILCGLAAVIYAYAFGLKHFSRQAGIFAALLFSFSFIFVFYAPIARMYIPGVFFSLGLLYHFYAVFFSADPKRRDYILLGLFALLSAFNQHINSLFAFTVCCSGFFFLNRTNYKPYLLTCVLVVLAYLPHLPVTLYQLSVPGIGRENGGWLEAPEFTVLFSFLKTLAGTGKTYLIILLILFASVVLNRKLPLSKSRLYLLFLFLLNFLIVYGYSVWRSPVFQYSVMLFAGTAIVLFFCSCMEFKDIRVFYTMTAVLGLALLYKSYIKKDYFGQSVKTVYEYQFERTAHYKKVLGNQNVYPLFFDADAIMKKIYFKKYHTWFDCKISSDSMISNMERTFYGPVSSLRLFSHFIKNLPCDYVVLTSAMPQHQAIVKEYYPFLLENTQTQGINFKLYSRRQTDRTYVVEDDAVDYISSLKHKGAFQYSKENNVIQAGEGFYLKADSLNEFPFDAKADLAAVTQKEGQVVLVRAKLRLKQAYAPLELCVSVTDRTNNEQYAYNSKAASDFEIGRDSLLTMYSEHFNGTRYKASKYRSDLNCYLWNRGRENFELLDFDIRVIDYWPRKWNLWD